MNFQEVDPHNNANAVKFAGDENLKQLLHPLLPLLNETNSKIHIHYSDPVNVTHQLRTRIATKLLLFL